MKLFTSLFLLLTVVTSQASAADNSLRWHVVLAAVGNEQMVVETYAHVHHIVSNVRGQLVAGATPIDAVKAVFPGGG